MSALMELWKAWLLVVELVRWMVVSLVVELVVW